jgi:hypothetical protein
MSAQKKARIRPKAKQVTKADALMLSTAPGAAQLEATDNYNAVVAQAQLADISLMSLHFNVEPQIFAHLRELKLSFDVEVSGISQHDKPQDDFVSGVFEWSVEGRHNDKVLLSIEASWFVMYRGVGGQQPKAIEAFVDRVGRFASYPYFRSLVAQISWSSNIELPILPVLR